MQKQKGSHLKTNAFHAVNMDTGKFFCLLCGYYICVFVAHVATSQNSLMFLLEFSLHTGRKIVPKGEGELKKIKNYLSCYHNK